MVSNMAINITKHVPLYDDAHLHSIKRDFKNIRPMAIVDIADRWGIESRGLSDIEKSINDVESYILSLLDKIEEMDGIIVKANDTIEALTEEVSDLLTFSDAIEIYDNSNEIIKWCHDNLHGDWNYFVPPLKPSSNYSCIYIKNDEDRIHFKLRWG